MRRLEAYRGALGARPLPPPHFDPFDGGETARLLVLLETPGRSAAPVRFVSADNRTGTARNLRRAFAEAGLDRRERVIWNAAPWVLQRPGERNRAPRRDELAAGLAELPALLDLLPRLRVALLAGRAAGLAAPVLARHRPELTVIRTCHPSPIYACTGPDILPGFIADVAAAAARLA